ncbi:MAG: hypothetical protein HZA89_02040 [Verrucomicrobia bacterium]|nr:hypothetical protein [Verrucomicrobiota bacterium]
MLASSLFLSAAFGQLPLQSVPRGDFMIPNGQVSAIVEQGGVVYIGGAFTEVGTNTGHAAIIYATNGSPLPNFPRFVGDVNTAIPDGNGGWFVGGNFIVVDGVSKSRLAHILPDRTLDPNFSADFDSRVNALLLNGGNLVVGGNFTRVVNTVNGTPVLTNACYRLVVLDPASGTVRPMASALAFSGEVLALLAIENTLYVGGGYLRVTNVLAESVTNVVSRVSMTAVDLTTGQPTPFQADASTNIILGFPALTVVSSLATDGARLFMGGSFTSILNNAVAPYVFPRRLFAAVDKDTGVPLTNGWLDFSSSPRALAVGSNALYIGGGFLNVTQWAFDQITSTYTNQIFSRTRLAALNLSDDTVNTHWTPQTDTTVETLFFAGTNIFVAGSFNSVTENDNFGSAYAKKRVVAITSSTTSDSLVWNGFNVDAGGTVNTIASDGTGAMFIGGGFQFVKGTPRHRLAAFNARTGQLLPWNPRANNNVVALVGIGSNIWAGGDFTFLTNSSNLPVPRGRLAALDTNLGNPVASFTNGANDTVRALIPSETNLFVGGDFFRVTNGSTALLRTNVARMSLSNGVFDTNFTAHVGMAGAVVTTNNISSLALSGTNLYLGGPFTSVNGVKRHGLAAVNFTSGVVNTNWRCDVGDSNVFALAVHSNSLFVAGQFTRLTNYSGTNAITNARNRLAAVSLADGIVTSWNPIISAPSVSPNVMSLATRSTNVYAGGQFIIIANRARGRLAEINTSTNISVSINYTTAWNPDASDTVWALYATSNRLFAGGSFATIGTNSIGRFAVFEITSEMLVFTNTLTYTVGQPPLVVDDSVTIRDPDPVLLTNALISFDSNATSLYVSFEDYLLFDFTNGITGTFDPACGQLALSGAASLAQYDEALRSVRYFNTNSATTNLAAFTPGLRRVRFTADGHSAARPINVIAVNLPPAVDPIVSLTMLEDSGLTNITLTGISSGGGITQMLAFTVTTGNPVLFTNQTVNYTNPAGTGVLRFSSRTNQSGTATFTVVLTDDGGTFNGGVDAVTNTFEVVVLPVNDIPTLAVLTNQIILEDAPLQTVPLTSIAAGGGETQNLTVTAASSDPLIIPNPTVSYTSPATNGSLSYAPLPDASGIVTITVTVQDDGGTDNGGVDTLIRTFMVTVLSTNDAPTLTLLSNLTLNEDAGPQLLNLTGITAGGGETQTLTVTAFSSDTNIIAAPVVAYASPDTTSTLNFTPLTNAFGTVTLTVIVRDDGGTANGGLDALTNTFSVVVRSVNDPPTLNAVSNMVLALNARPQTNVLTGITGGPTNEVTLEGQFVAFPPELQVVSDTNLISSVTVSYTLPGTTAQLVFTPAASQFGTATTITLVAQDSGATTNGGVNAVTNTFTVTVRATNAAPTLEFPANPVVILEDVSQAIVLGNISAGLENQPLTVTAVSSDTNIVASATVVYSSPDSTGQLVLRSATNTSGTATITVTVRDDGGTDGGGVDTFTTNLTVVVLPVNDVPVLAAVTNLTILEDAAPTNLTLTIVAPGGGSDEGSQIVTLTAFISESVVPVFVTDTNVLAPPVLNFTPGTNYPATGTLTLTPLTNAFGTVTITVLARDDGGTDGGGVDTLTNTFRVVVTNVNDAPTMNPFSNLILAINAPVQYVPMTGIAPGPSNESTQFLAFNRSVSASPPALLTTTGVTNTYIAPRSTGMLSFKPAANQVGTATITVTILDSAGTVNGGRNSRTNTFTVTVLPTNSTPTLALETNALTTLEDAGPQVISVTNITAGLENQILTLRAVSSDSNLVTFLATNYTSPNTTGQIVFAPAPNATGTAIITVSVKDDGGTTAGGVDTVASVFTVTVLPVNDAPTLDAPSNLTILEDSGVLAINLTNISAGVGETQGLTFAAFSSDTNILTAPVVSYTSPDNFGSLTFATVTNVGGTVTISVLVQDDGGTASGGVDALTNTFTITVLPVNDAPTLDPITNLTVADNAGTVAVNLGGIGTGAANEAQAISITASSSDSGIVVVTNISHVSPGATGSLALAPVPGASGVATISVVVQDDGGTADGGVDAVTNTFTVTVERSAPPVLLINRAPGGVAVSWPQAASNFVLQTTTNLTVPAPFPWSNSTSVPSLSGSNWVVTNDASGRRLFRLIRP